MSKKKNNPMQIDCTTVEYFCSVKKIKLQNEK